MDNLKSIKSTIECEWSRFESALKETLSSDNIFINSMNRYLFDNSGKMIRPILSLLTASACGGVNDLSIKCAVVSEVMHTASLLHDDVADNSHSRRGVPTINKLFSPAASVLMGDYWLSKAIKVLVSERLDERIMYSFAKAIEDLSEGELIQMNLIGDTNITEEDYLLIASKKTSSLFIASMKNGAISANAPANIVAQIEKCAFNIGVAFQIRDDILDYSPGSNTGKPVYADIKERKITIPLIGALKNASSTGDIKERDSVMKMISYSEDKPLEMEIESIITFIEKYNGIDYAAGVLTKVTQEAIDSLQDIPDSQYRRGIEQIVKRLRLS